MLKYSGSEKREKKLLFVSDDRNTINEVIDWATSEENKINKSDFIIEEKEIKNKKHLKEENKLTFYSLLIIQGAPDEPPFITTPSIPNTKKYMEEYIEKCVGWNVERSKMKLVKISNFN